jgi:hypothetical protein
MTAEQIIKQATNKITNNGQFGEPIQMDKILVSELANNLAEIYQTQYKIESHQEELTKTPVGEYLFLQEYKILRVPNGWIYNNRELKTSTFVPENRPEHHEKTTQQTR